jgi:hypothetical protein
MVYIETRKEIMNNRLMKELKSAFLSKLFIIKKNNIRIYEKNIIKSCKLTIFVLLIKRERTNTKANKIKGKSNLVFFKEYFSAFIIFISQIASKITANSLRMASWFIRKL